MNKQLWKDSLGWGAALWLIGYMLGIVLFFVVPPAYLGWFIMPIGIAITFWVLFNKVKGETMMYFFILALVWTAIAIICDYFFLVQLFKPEDGYYKLDVYIYYAITFLLPLAVGKLRTKSEE